MVVRMDRRLIIMILCAALVLTMTACGESKEEKAEEAKAKREEIRQENEAAANAVISSIESLPEEEDLTLKDEPAVDGARTIYEELTDDQKLLVSSDKVAKLEAAERVISELNYAEEERQRNMKEDKKAAAKAEEAIDGIPDKVTMDAEAAVEMARASYNQLTDDQKSYVKKSALDKLEAAEKEIERLYEEEEKKAEEEEKKAEEKARKKAEKKAKKDKKKKDSDDD
ncbi:MAG: hypothetical protein IKF07_00235 [Eubacterium sp.]|nr:hypothetical protein [Eubacterium sp.]